LIENEENLGIAAALNQGIQWAIAKGYQWVILLDQDSTITDEFASHMFATWKSHPEHERVCSIHPKYIDPDTGREALVRRAEDGGPIISMTSGALMPTWVFTQLGLFASDLFIDEVDTEYCLRIRASGYLVIDSREAVLLHSAGHSQGKVVLGFRFRPSFHSPMRRYYMARNRVVVYRRYFRTFPRWILLFTMVSLRETLKCLLSEPGRARKLRNMALGTWDGLTGQMGRREGLE
jgi:rhamnosyltransferase